MQGGQAWYNSQRARQRCLDLQHVCVGIGKRFTLIEVLLPVGSMASILQLRQEQQQRQQQRQEDSRGAESSLLTDDRNLG